MSLNEPKIPVVKVLDPRLQFQEQRDYVALKGARVNSFQQFPATTLNNSNVVISCNPPSHLTAVSRLVLKRMVFDITVTGTNTGLSGLLVPNFYAPRCMPITMVTQSESFTIGNATFSQSPIQQYWGALMWYHNEFKNRFGQYSLAPSMLDQFQDYAQGSATVRNPLAGYGDNSFENTRGGYAGLEVLSNPGGGTTATLRLTSTEPILLSPLVSGAMSNYTSAIGQVQNMSYQCVFADLSRVLSLVQNQGSAGVINLTGVAVTLSSAELLFNYLTPQQDNEIPRSLQSSYFSIVSYPTRTSVAILPGATTGMIPMQSVQLAQVPRRIYIFARRDDSTQTAFTSDAYFALPQRDNPLSLTFNNNQFLASSSTEDLYNISVKNGCTMSYSQFVNRTGSVICLDFSTDIGLEMDQSAGALGNYQLSLTCRFRNTHPTASIAPTMYVVVVYEGVVNINDGSATQMLGVLSPSDVLNAQSSPHVSYKEQNDVYGGSFFSKIRDALSSANRFLKQHKVVSSALSLVPDPRAKAAASIASQLGYGGRRRGRRNMRGAGLADEVERVNLSKLVAEDDENFYDDEQKYYDE